MLATLTLGSLAVSLEFRFAETGEVVAVYTPARWCKLGQTFRQLPWEGHFRDYHDRQGFRVPMEGEVGWYLDQQWQAVWTGRITAVSFELQS